MISTFNYNFDAMMAYQTKPQINQERNHHVEDKTKKVDPAENSFAKILAGEMGRM